MEERYNHVLELLRSKKDLLEYIANRLIEVETMDSKEFNDIIKAHEHCEDLTAAAQAEATSTASESESVAPAQTETSAESKEENLSSTESAEPKSEDQSSAESAETEANK